MSLPPVFGTLQTGTYAITNVHNKLNVVLKGDSDKNGQMLARADPSTEWAKWNITRLPNGNYHIHNYRSPMHAATTQHGGTEGAYVKTLDTRAQQWTIRETSTRGNYIISVQGGEYFWGLPDDDEETFVQLASVPNHKNNQWNFAHVRV
ncbi:hypothetical protein MD484_g5243, partial [Candolleomyces efflorescens]